MKRTYQLLTAAVCSGVALAASVAGFCISGIFRCSVGTNFSLMEAVGPLALLVIALFSISGVILTCAACVVTLTTRLHQPFHGIVILLGGALAGFIPRLAWEILTGSFPETFYPHLEYVPFGIAGIVTIVVLMLVGFGRVE